MNKTIQVPLSEEDINTLKAGDYVYLSGIIYTARDAAHKRMYESMHKGESLPIELNGNVLYYLGPSPAREGQVIGSAGPTTSSRMDKYTPEMLDKGLKGMVGKGKRSPEVIEAMKRNGAVYFAAVGGAGALLSKCIKKAEVIAYDDLGTEADAQAILRIHGCGVPVIAAGIPTLMDSDEGADLVVTPRALDSVIAHGSALLAGAINRALQPRLSVAQLFWLAG